MRKPKSKARRERERRERLAAKGITVSKKMSTATEGYLKSLWFPWKGKTSSTSTKPSHRSKKHTHLGGADVVSDGRSILVTWKEP